MSFGRSTRGTDIEDRLKSDTGQQGRPTGAGDDNGQPLGLASSVNPPKGCTMLES